MKIELNTASARHPAARPGVAPAIRALDLHIGAGEQVAVIGPSGAGKTTLLQLLACALPPSAGVLRLDGQSPWQLPRAELQRLRGRLVLAPQVPPLPPRQRVVTAVLAGRLPAMGLGQSLRSLFYPVDIPAAFEALDRFHLADKLFERVDRLSGGERQRVALARAIVAMGPAHDGRSAGPPQTRPAPWGGSAARAAASVGATLLLIDEPLSALDPTRAHQAIDTLLSAARERGATLVTTLHQVDVALAHFPRIVGLRNGALAFDVPATQVTPQRLADLYAQHEHELRGEAPVADETPPAPQPVVMHCR